VIRGGANQAVALYALSGHDAGRGVLRQAHFLGLAIDDEPVPGVVGYAEQYRRAADDLPELCGKGFGAYSGEGELAHVPVASQV
jgi:hypothetical protein